MPERCYTKAMKISDDSLEFLTELLETPSPSGFEIDAQRIWADELRKYTEDVSATPTEIPGPSSTRTRKKLPH